MNRAYGVVVAVLFCSGGGLCQTDPTVIPQQKPIPSASSSPPTAAVASQPPSSTSPWKLTADRTMLDAGQKYTVTLEDSASDCPKSHSFNDLGSVVSSSPSEIIVGSYSRVLNNACQITVPISVATLALSGRNSLLLKSKSLSDLTLGIVTLSIRSPNPTQAGPIAPGLPAPQLDIMWKVLPRQPVADSYGSRVADGFFAIEATFGNQTGYDLQIAALGFESPSFICDVSTTPQKFDTSRSCKDPFNKFGLLKPVDASSTDKPTMPVDAYPIVRGTVEREQFVGTRAVVVNLVKAAGPILVGVGGAYFPATDSFNRATEIFVSPFEKGLELVYPDLTTNHLISLDNRALRDGAVIPNNSAIRINAFISRELVQCGFPRHWYSLSTRTSHFDWDCRPGDTRLPYAQNFRPADVVAHLGRIVLIGQPIQYLNRIRVVQDEDKQEAHIGPLVTSSVLVMPKGSTATLAFAGINLQNATVVADRPKEVIITDVKASADGSSVSFGVDATNATAASYELQIVTRYGVTRASL